jgi:L-lactate permease
MSQMQAWLPYVLICILLVVSRIPSLGLKGWLLAHKLKFVDILGFKGVNASIDYLYLPGTFFILVALCTILLHKMPKAAVSRAWGESLRKMKSPTIALVFAVALVSIFRGSAVNPIDVPSMELLSNLASFILHVDVHLFELAQQYGLWVYAILFVVVFCETGLVVTPFLPGDSLLFASGVVAGAGLLGYGEIMRSQASK